jgi:hypothetical protein
MSVHLGARFWLIRGGKLDEIGRFMLSEPFLEKEVEMAIVGMKLEYAPGPNGFIVTFFKKFWKHIKKEIMQMVQDLSVNQ